MTNKKEVTKTTKNRVVYFDYLRIFATLSVIFIHVASSKWYVTNVNGYEWQTFNFYDSIMRWGVPVFVMISGALFLNKEIPTKKLYAKYILKMLIAFFAWSITYALVDGKGISVSGIVSVIKGHYHMWFIPMIIGLYMCIPLIRPIIKRKERIKYFLLLSLIFVFVVPSIVKFVSVFGGGTMKAVMGAISSWINSLNIKMVLGHTGLFILGYYLNKIKIKRKYRLLIYIGGLLSAAATVVLSLIASLKNQAPNGVFYDHLTLNILLQAIAAFVWFKHRNYQNEKINMIANRLSKCCFGVYLVHPLVLSKLLELTSLSTLSFNAMLSVPAIVAIVFAISLCISAVLNHIPFIKKYAV